MIVFVGTHHKFVRMKQEEQEDIQMKTSLFLYLLFMQLLRRLAIKVVTKSTTTNEMMANHYIFS